MKLGVDNYDLRNWCYGIIFETFLDPVSNCYCDKIVLILYSIWGG